MRPGTVLLIRHAEKPGEAWPGPGLTEDGGPDPKSLALRGWQRAGALAALVAPGAMREGAGQDGTGLPRPDAIYASAFREGGGHSRRPEQTVRPLAAKLGLAVDLTYALHQEGDLAAHLLAQGGIALVSWQHEGLAELLRALLGPGGAGAPPHGWRWPDARYDVTWRVDRDATGRASFTQHPHRLLAGDGGHGLTLA